MHQTPWNNILCATIQPIQKRTPGPTYPQQTRKSLLLLTPPASISLYKKQNLQRLPFRDSQYHYKQHISRPHSATSSKQQPPLLPNPTISGPHCATSSKQPPPLLPTPVYHYTVPAYYEADSIGP